VTRIDVRLVTCAELPTDDPDTPILRDALTDAGARVDVANWRDPSIEWAQARVTVLRSPWDYVDAVDEFVRWVRATGARTKLFNPPELVEWNVHKSYLLSLQATGAPVVPTVVLLQGGGALLDGICDAQGWNRVVVKPAVGIGAHGAGRFDVGDPAGQAHLDELLTDTDVLVQPFVESVETDGEMSVFVLGGEVTHAVRKRPAADDYRVHDHWGGSSELVAVPPALAELARRTCAALPAPPLYARIDLLRARDTWQIVEVEATEPSLWLDVAPATATQTLVAATIAQL
jgi:glutathione synthase/RimK-type ligase-like ATP-grasp enzyme